ncbi:4-hydroxy-3-methylbut-2-enyl diphosphate reductase [Dehalococcoidia bacterium]|nr:4-hydroxy-3-methylbut-2-enyl diphosphate reductase [Dehalococcoidia bacterium]|tara:strand:- start:32 stop:943 length:912 start_codon:yes stop_codon:yes gene_type:complete
MDIYLANPRGFCAGVDLAINIVNLAIKKYGPPIYIKHQIVHNSVVVDDVESRGAITVNTVDEIPIGSVVVFSAHGSPPSDYEKAKKRKLTILDATCPLVTKVHNEAKKYSTEGKKVILVGHKNHQEVIGTSGQAELDLIDDKRPTIPSYKKESEIVILTQTTLSVRDTSNAIKKVKNSYPNVTVRNDICYATTNRQSAVESLKNSVDLILVIGANNSSNCNRLKETAIAAGKPAYLISSPEEIKSEWLDGIKKIGITSGASTPESQVNNIVNFLSPENVHQDLKVREDVSFSIPRQLRFLVDK